MWLQSKALPIGIDIGRQTIKAIQLQRSGSGLRVVARARGLLPETLPDDTEAREEVIIDVLKQMMGKARFRGRQVVVCLGGDELFVQNVRIPKIPDAELENVVRWEAEERVPFDGASAEIRHMMAGEVRQGDEVRNEVILLATQPAHIQQKIRMMEAARLQPQAIDAHPCAAFRWFANMLRRESDAEQVHLFVDIGAVSTKMIVASGPTIIFVKDIAIGGRSFTTAVARKLDLESDEAYRLRRRVMARTGDCPTEEEDPEVTRAVFDAVRPVMEDLGREIALCARYCSVTFRGRKADAAYLFGGEARPTIVPMLEDALEVPVQIAEPGSGLRDGGADSPDAPLSGDWIVALGLSRRCA